MDRPGKGDPAKSSPLKSGSIAGAKFEFPFDLASVEVLLKLDLRDLSFQLMSYFWTGDFI